MHAVVRKTVFCTKAALYLHSLKLVFLWDAEFCCSCLSDTTHMRPLCAYFLTVLHELGQVEQSLGDLRNILVHQGLLKILYYLLLVVLTETHPTGQESSVEQVPEQSNNEVWDKIKGGRSDSCTPILSIGKESLHDSFATGQRMMRAKQTKPQNKS